MDEGEEGIVLAQLVEPGDGVICDLFASALYGLVAVGVWGSELVAIDVEAAVKTYGNPTPPVAETVALLVTQFSHLLKDLDA